VVSASEAGAAVKVDGSIVGTTPLESRQALVAGPHLVELEKEGFVKEQREVRVTPDTVQEQSFQLVPSPDTIAAYEARAQRLRVIAWGTTGLAAVGAGVFVGFLLHANAVYGSPTTEGTFACMGQGAARPGRRVLARSARRGRERPQGRCRRRKLRWSRVSIRVTAFIWRAMLMGYGGCVYEERNLGTHRGGRADGMRRRRLEAVAISHQ
jgi:hypothetical protein